MDSAKPILSQHQDFGASKHGVGMDRMFGSLPCFSEMGESLENVKRKFRGPICGSYPINPSLCVARSFNSGLNSNKEELPSSLNSMLAGFVNSIGALPGQSKSSSDFELLNLFECLQMMDIGDTQQEPTIVESTVMLSYVPVSPPVGLTYAQVTKLTPNPMKKVQKINLPIMKVKTIPKSIDIKEVNKSHSSPPIVFCTEVSCNRIGEHRMRKGGRQRKKRSRKGSKKELGSKKSGNMSDPDGSVWASQNTSLAYQSEDSLHDSPSLNLLTSCPVPITSNISSMCPGGVSPLSQGSGSSNRHRSTSECSEDSLFHRSSCSECSDDVLLTPRPLARLRSMSECSTASIDSEDSFIVFGEDCDDEVDFICSSQFDFIRQPVGKGQTQVTEFSRTSSPPQSTPVKTVRFNDNVTVHPLVVWSSAQRLARLGPWEQMARDRARFSQRIASVADQLNRILDPAHRETVYKDRFL